MRSSGSNAVIRTPMPVPGVSFETLSIEGAVGEIDIGMPALEEQRAVARRHPAIAVAGGVADDIGFGLEDATAGDAFRQLANH
ncbi:hypothetical protein NKH47_30410 [Mesorhizobium sp. M1060]|uniref:hypothetical protein n=1 Tax=unclassified Mesorhizobium TaxID=325217 RepID=UPI001FDAAF69|nr:MULTISPECIES: hypothetical protein [unclassified Mesorhizobium]